MFGSKTSSVVETFAQHHAKAQLASIVVWVVGAVINKINSNSQGAKR